MRQFIKMAAKAEKIKMSSSFRVRSDPRVKLLVRDRNVGRSKYQPHVGKKQIGKAKSKIGNL